MKLFLAILISVMASASSNILASSKQIEVPPQISANSKMGQRLMSKATFLTEEGEQSRALEDNNFEPGVLSSYSLIFEECYNTTSWYEGVQYIRLVRFKLCHSNYCSDKCRSYMAGNYIVDMETFVDAYLEATLDEDAYKCEMVREQCGCDGDNDDCMYYCYKSYDDDFTWSKCVGEQEEEARYGECQELRVENNNNNGRQLNNNNNNNNGQYFTAPICGPTGTTIHMGIFNDEDCNYPISNPDYVYRMMSGGYKMPYSLSSGVSLVDSQRCISCKEPGQDQNDDDGQDEDDVIRMCEELHENAAKCETYMSDLGNYRDTSDCTYINDMENGNTSGYQMAFSGSSVSLASILVLFGGVMALVGVTAYYVTKKRRTRTSTPLMIAEMTTTTTIGETQMS